MKNKFSVELRGVFYTLTLYDEKGREVFTLEEAIQAAENEYGSEWSAVFNGEEGVAREEIQSIGTVTDRLL